MKMLRKIGLSLGLLALLLESIILPCNASAAIVTATGTNPSACNQSVSDQTGVSAYRNPSGDCVIEFTSTSVFPTWTVPLNLKSMRVLVVGGGGGGGAHVGSGGGGGGLLDISNLTPVPGAGYTITIGSGGLGAKSGAGCTNPSTGITGENKSGTGTYCNDISKSTRSTDGGSSSFIGSGISISASGGGGGGSWNYFYPHSGGSGAGASTSSGSASTAGSGTLNQGNDGGAYSGNYGTGGGGGATGVGGTGSANQGGTGGTGYSTSTLTGSVRSFAGGGGGGCHDSGTGGTASSGGGAGRCATSTKGYNGTANTGGGGGGSGYANTYSSEGGDGGSGIVIIKYTPDTNPPTISSGGSANFAENTAVTTNATTLVVSESSTLTLTATTDSPLFTFVVLDSVTARIRFVTSPDYENPQDSGKNNVYDLVVQAVDLAGNSANLAVTITVTNVNEASSIGVPTVSGNVYKGVVISLTVTTDVAGKVRFFLDGKRIATCLAVATSGTYPNFTASCSWKPATTSKHTVTASLTPTDNTFSGSTSSPASIWILKRTSNR